MTSNNRQQPAADRIGHYVRPSIRPAANPSVKRAGAAKRESAMVAMLGWAARRASYGRSRRERRTQKCGGDRSCSRSRRSHGKIVLRISSGPFRPSDPRLSRHFGAAQRRWMRARVDGFAVSSQADRKTVNLGSRPLASAPQLAALHESLGNAGLTAVSSSGR